MEPIEIAWISIRPEHEPCEDPIEIEGIIIIRARAHPCKDPIETEGIIVIIIIIITTKVNRLFEGFNILKKSPNLAVASVAVKI